jgi:Fur family ferric uptake transcriptional regulator
MERRAEDGMTTSSIEYAQARLREAGYRLTNARRFVLQVLFENERHLTSSQILERVLKCDAHIGRASVYRTLELLTELAIVRPTFLEPRTPNYIVMPADGHHAHLVCTCCGRVIELGACELEDFIRQLAQTHRFELSGHLLELYGMCEDCAHS